jgi:hypothetical protein
MGSLNMNLPIQQDLLSLFIKYQIPSDLVSYDGPEANSIDRKISIVKEYVGRMQSMFDAAKKAELEEAERQQQMRLAQQERARRAQQEQARRAREQALMARDDLLANITPQRDRLESVNDTSGGGIISSLFSAARSVYGAVTAPTTTTIPTIGYAPELHMARSAPAHVHAAQAQSQPQQQEPQPKRDHSM